MPFTRNDCSDRVDFSGLLTPEEVSFIANTPSIRTLQFDSAVHSDNWRLLEEHLFRRRPDICLRAYGPYSNCDVSFVKQMPALENFGVDCIRKVSGIQALESLPNLRHLSIGVLELDNFDFLSTVSTGLKSLMLSSTLSTKPDVSVLSRFKQLEELFIGGHLKGLQVLPSLPNLGKLRFWGLKSPNLDFLPKMPSLWSIEFALGGGEDFSPIAGVAGLKALEITWVRRLQDLEFISNCINLQRLTLDRLRQVESLPNFERLTQLRGLAIAGMNGLKSVDSIVSAPALEGFGGSAKLLQPEDFRVALQAPSLRRASFYYSSEKKCREFDAIAAEYGVSTTAEYEKFVFN